MPVWELQDGIRLGKILKPYGYLGFVRVAFLIPGLDKVLNVEGFMFLEWIGKPVPYQIEELIWDDDKSARVKFADIATLNDASKFIGRQVILSEKTIPKKLLKHLEPNELIGFEVVDMQNNVLGIVSGLDESGHQSILEVDSEKGQFLIPFHKDLVRKTDFRNKKIIVDLPEGLLDL